MQRKALQLVVLGCLVALAGCSGALSGAGGEQTLDDVSYPDGVSENGTNVSALADAHSTALENESFTLDVQTGVNSSSMNQSVSIDAQVGPNRDAISANTSTSGQQMSLYLTDEKRYERAQVEGETQYRVTNRTPNAMQLVQSSFEGQSYLDQFAGMGNFTPTEVRDVNGTTLIVLEADGSDATAEQAGETEQPNLTDYDATILVDERGVVHSMTVEATSRQDGQAFDTEFSMELSDVGETTVAEPSWLDDAENQTSS